MAIANVLFVCVDNALLSLMAEAYANAKSNGVVRAFSGGPMPVDGMNEYGRKILADKGIADKGLEPKSWNIFAFPHAPQPDFVVELQSDALMMTPPKWANDPVVSKWQVVPGNHRITSLEDAKTAFRRIRESIDRALLSGQFETNHMLWRVAG
ncbi:MULTISPECIES: low molecular weight phosphatase family protein [Pseudovibrio]|uniref:arsenate-mycothiol transferase ArsC n=1 Tax=Stappiaceae TaxID=2821832 RepID=UPI0023652D18|nr:MULTISPECIES: low molecular weight phosphatase family protein [Pseudovibrio]MDD7909743.1 low molecular weight phosphatase family protein [Pseudovibrio exalbescens]MDX5592085.1 low molecular weight phosphatase family protein [Pseudovibrio sp. SPO723]